jgi:hypothetical protein
MSSIRLNVGARVVEVAPEMSHKLQSRPLYTQAAVVVIQDLKILL